MTQRQAVEQNCELLRLCFNTLNAVIREYGATRRSGVEQCDMFTVSATTKIIYQRWEQEKRKLGTLPPPCTAFDPPAPLPLPTIPDYLQDTIHKEIQQSAFFQTLWGKAFPIQKGDGKK